MHLKVFLKLKKTIKPTLLGKKPPPKKKPKKNKKKPLGCFFQPWDKHWNTGLYEWMPTCLRWGWVRGPRRRWTGSWRDSPPPSSPGWRPARAAQRHSSPLPDHNTSINRKTYLTVQFGRKFYQPYDNSILICFKISHFWYRTVLA